jgi:photosystem II stability/assembly factor-like uncharacterized protein
MASKSDRVLYIGTWEGLYAATENGATYGIRLLGLESPPPPKDWKFDHRRLNPAGKGRLTPPVVIDKDDANRLYAGTTRAGVFISEDAGHSWRECNQGLTSKEVWALVQHPQTGELYAGVEPTGVFKSFDRGESWLECMQLRTLPSSKMWTFPAPPHFSHIKDICLAPDDSKIVYCAIEEGGAVRSFDAGETWEQMDQQQNGLYNDVHTVNLRLDNYADVISTTGKGVYRSSDRGDHWSYSADGLEHRTYMSQIRAHPERPNVMFTSAASGPPPTWPRGTDSGVFRSDDYGVRWQHLVGGLPEVITAGARCTAMDPEDPNAVLCGFSDGTVYMTENGGESFRKIVDGIPHVLSITVGHR